MSALKAPPPEAGFKLQEVFESVQPGRQVRLISSVQRLSTGGTTPGTTPRGYLVATLPGSCSLYCSDSDCERAQNFGLYETSTSSYSNNKAQFVVQGPSFDFYVDYICRNCYRTIKTYAVRITTQGDADIDKVFVYKFGEIPQFGPPLPAKLLQLAGDHANLLKKGRQAENQSLGVGAFAYYRRVVELQKSRLIDEIKKAVERLGGSDKTLEDLETARAENQFTKALELMAAVTPKELFVNGHNPLKLLHEPLSVGLHALSDEECLKRAHHIRMVLGAMLERIQMVTEVQAELDAAIKDLLHGK